MKLAVIVDTFPRWSERFIARECGELVRRGVDLRIFCLRAGTLPDGGENDADFAGLLERRIELPRCIMPRALNGDGEDAELRRRRDLAKKELGLTAYAKVQCAKTLADLLAEGKFTQVHAHFANLPSTIAWLAAHTARLPLTLSVHARDLFVEAQLLDAKIADCKRVFTCHARAQEFLVAMNPHAAKKIVLMRHGLPLEHYSFEQREPAQTPQILAAGRFVPKKGFETLLAAVADPRLRERSFRLILLGEGQLEKKLKAQIERKQLGSKVMLHGPVSGEPLKNLFRHSSLFLAPYETASDGDSDGVPNTILEAFALGLPVVGTAAGSLREVLTPETGTVVAEKNPAELAAAIAGFLDDAAVYGEKTRAARKLIEKDYDLSKNIAPLLK
ncbi:MAG TPA: glycosyltransferase family 4 protein [Planctomycetota bacterium]|nr:glycosyltransferase family 4 protein [Planctomycetota bacterium]